MKRDGQKESRDEQKQASDIPSPRTLADIEPLYKLSKKPCAEVLEPDPSEKFDPWTDWQKDQLPVVQETPTADNEAGGDSQNWGSSDTTPIVTPRAHQRHRMSQEGDAPINVTEEDIDDYLADCGNEPPPHGDDAALGKMQEQWGGVLGPDGELAMTEAEAIERMRIKHFDGKETVPKNIKVQETSAVLSLEDLQLFAHRPENLKCINCQSQVQRSFLVIPSLEGLDKRTGKGQTGQFFGKVYGTCPLCAWREDKKNHLPSCECDFCKDKIFHYEAEVCELVCRSRPIKDSFWKKHKKSAEGHWKFRTMALRDKGVAPLRTPILLLSPNLPTSPLSPPPPYPFTPHL
jgi:hypothetical protein